MNNLIQQIQAQHDADETWYAYRDDAWPSGYPRPAQHKDRGDLLEVINAARVLLERWRDLEDSTPRKLYQSGYGCADELEALLDGDAP